MKLSQYLRLVFYPKMFLRNTFHYGVIYGQTETMMNHGILQHPVLTQKDILKKMDFEAKYPTL